MNYEARAKMMAARRLERAEPGLVEPAGQVVEVIEREAEIERREVGFNARLLVQATLPHSKMPADQTEFERRNGNLVLSIIAKKKHGLPYGTYPRLLLAWLTTEAVRTKSRDIELGASLRSFMGKLGIGTSGGENGEYARLRRHMASLFTATVSAVVDRENGIQDIGFRVGTKVNLFWDPKSPEQESLWQSTLRLSEEFYEEVTNRPVPVDLAVLRDLVKLRSPLAIDIYQWLTYRMSYLNRATHIPWELLELQFGAGYKRTIDFRRRFTQQLKLVAERYPEARFTVDSKCLRLNPSPTHVRQLKHS